MALLVSREQWTKNPTRGGLSLNPRWASAEYVWHPLNSVIPGQRSERDAQSTLENGEFGPCVRSANNGSFNGYGPTFGGRSPSVTALNGWTVLCVYRHISNGFGQGNLVRTSTQNGLGINAGVPILYFGTTALHTSSIAAPTDKPAVIIARMQRSGTDEIYVNGVRGVSGANGGFNYNGTLTRLGSGFGQGHNVGQYYLAASFPWYMSASDIEELTLNPWQIFQAQQKPVFYSLGGNTSGAGSSSLTFAASAAGAANKPAAGTSSLTFAASAVGNARKPAAGSSSITFGASAVGTTGGNTSGAGSSSITFAASGAGASIRAATGSSSIAFSASAVSTAPAADEAAAPLQGGHGTAQRKRRRYILPDDTEVMATDVEIRDILKAFVKPKPQPKKRGQVAKVVPLSAQVTLEPDPVKKAERVVVDMNLATWSPDQQMLDAMVRQIVTTRRRRVVELLLMAA